MQSSGASRQGLRDAHAQLRRQLLEAVDEQIRLARESGCRLEISHLQAVGRANWHKQEQALEKIEKARQEGVDVGFDIYPYLAGSTMLTQFLPQSALVNGVDGMVALLKDRSSAHAWPPKCAR